LDLENAAFWLGAAAVILSFCWIAYLSVVGEALHNYALSYLFELIPEEDEPRQRRFEELCRRDVEFIQVAEIGRILGFIVHILGWAAMAMALAGAPELSRTVSVVMPIVVIATFVSLVVCVIILPPLLLRHREEAALLVLLPSFAWLALLFKPLTVIGNSLRLIGARIEGVSAEDSPQESFEEDLADSLEEAEREGVLDEDERDMIHAVVELSRTPAYKAMIPRTDMICADAGEGLENAVRLAVEHGHSRIPVYEGDRDHIVGVFYSRDLVKHWGESPVKDLRTMLRPARYWPANKPLDELLREMRAERLKIAILTDEHGGTAGMITLEDILEEIVGDIQDEYDEGEADRNGKSITLLGDGAAEADGDLDLDEVNEALGIHLPEGAGYNSLGGLVLDRLGRLAAAGDEVAVDGHLLKVLDADERRIKRVRIFKQEAPSADPTDA
jgi:putative hemolysin